MIDTKAISDRRLHAVLLVVTVVCLLPFVTKAFHIDDPLFLWSAEHIRQHPLDFFGFKVNWYGVEMPMADITKNPPLMCYYLAAASWLLGWSEVSLHLACLLPAVAAIFGVASLARRLDAPPLASALATLATPAFLVSATSVMCDTLMLALWLWSIIFWLDGLKNSCRRDLWFAMLLAPLAVLSKYFALSLFPLLIVLAIAARTSFKVWLPTLAAPAVVLLAYELFTRHLYGEGHMLGAVVYARAFHVEGGPDAAAHALVALGYVGGCAVTAAGLAAMPGSRRSRLAGLLAATAAVGMIAGLSLWLDGKALRQANAAALTHVLVFSFLGVFLIFAAGCALAQRRDRASLLLGLWIGGTLVFACVLNWAVNARSLLPLAPATAILFTRQIHHSISPRWRNRLYIAVLAPAFALSLALAWSDASAANAVRRLASFLNEKHPAPPGGTLWFEGHWGFQYYMQRAGAKCLPLDTVPVKPGDLVALPSPNTYVFPLRPPENYETLATYCRPMSPPLLQGQTGARFYASLGLDAPYLLHRGEPICATVFRVRTEPAR